MKLGILARAEDRGLGIQTWEATRHLAPERVLVIDVQNGEGFPMHLDRYPGATIARLDHSGFLAETLVRDWLAGLDVVFSCETLYDWRLAEWARDAGCATVVQVNPEFFVHGKVPALAAPTAWWNPTTWRMDQLPAGTRHVPVPVALDRFADRPQAHAGPLLALHVVGRPAVGDRNGTELLAQAMRAVPAGSVELTISTQGHAAPWRGATAVRGAVGDYWKLYAGFDMLVMPRRFGGLCLPVQEAMAAGLAVVMPGCPPNAEMWPVETARWAWRGELPVPCGQLPLAATDPRDLAAVLGRLAADPEALAAAQARSCRWAAEHSWEALLPLYEEELARAADSRTLTP